MSSTNLTTNFTELELSIIAVILYLVISPLHGISKITSFIIKSLKLKSSYSISFFNGLLFGILYYFSIQLIMNPLYEKINISGFKVGGEVDKSKLGELKV